jgi:hypothetical protein
VVEAAFYQQTQQLRDARLTIETQKILFDRKHNKTPKGKKNNETDQEIAMTAFRSYFTFAEMVWSFATSHQLAAATIPETYDPLDRFRATPDEITQKTHAYVWLIGEVIRTKFNSLQSLELHEIFYHDVSFMSLLHISHINPTTHYSCMSVVRGSDAAFNTSYEQMQPYSLQTSRLSQKKTLKPS